MTDEASYKILRFFRDDRPTQIRRTGLTLQEAKEHCSKSSTHGKDWFDGYTREEN